MIPVLLSTIIVAQATSKPLIPGPCWHEATIAKQAQPIWPASLPASTPQLTAMVEVLVGTDGVVRDASIHQSTGYAAADAAAIEAARATVYRPKVVNCQPAEGRYLFKVDFTHSLTRPVSPTPTSALTPSVNSCPTKGVMRITLSGLVPSAGNPKNSPPPTTGPLVQTTNDWVMILVDVNPNGSVKGVKLLHSAGPALDPRFLHEARMSRYQPKMVDCRAVEGIYYFFAPIGNT